MEWLAAELTRGGRGAWSVGTAEDWHDVGDARRVYRFFEWFDWQVVPGARRLAEASAAGESGSSAAAQTRCCRATGSLSGSTTSRDP